MKSEFNSEIIYLYHGRRIDPWRLLCGSRTSPVATLPVCVGVAREHDFYVSRLTYYGDFIQITSNIITRKALTPRTHTYNPLWLHRSPLGSNSLCVLCDAIWRWIKRERNRSATGASKNNAPNAADLNCYPAQASPATTSRTTISKYDRKAKLLTNYSRDQPNDNMNKEPLIRHIKNLTLVLLYFDDIQLKK